MTEQAELAKAALDELLAWESLARSPQLACFLRYIVDATLEGNGASIKAYSIAVDVFGRPPDFDPQSDPIVRVQGGRLRSLINRFYDEGLNRVPLRIRVPVGRYVPEFEVLDSAELTKNKNPAKDNKSRADLQPSENQESETGGPVAIGNTDVHKGGATVRRRLSVLSATLLFGVVVACLAITIWRPLLDGNNFYSNALPVEPVISIGDFTNLTGFRDLDKPLEGLGLQLATDLSRFSDLIVIDDSGDDISEQIEGTALHREYALSGVARRGQFGVEFNILLTLQETREIVWTNSIVEPSLPGDYDLLIGRISHLAAGAVGSQRGPVHSHQRQWVVSNIGDMPGVNSYVCQLAYGIARDDPDAGNLAGAMQCFDRLIERGEDVALAGAGKAALQAIEVLMSSPPDARRDELLSEARRTVTSASEILPFSSFVYCRQGTVLNLFGDWEGARSAYTSAIQRNPADADVRAEFALMLAAGGEWQAGLAQMELAFSGTPAPSSWYYLVGTMKSLRDGDYETAYANSQILLTGSEQWGKAFALAAAALSGHKAEQERQVALALSNENFTTYGILPWMKRDIRDEQLLDALTKGLVAADLPKEVIFGPQSP